MNSFIYLINANKQAHAIDKDKIGALWFVLGNNELTQLTVAELVPCA